MSEHQHTEWKESWRDEYLRWICGFANAEGGVLVIGRNDRGEVVGAGDARRLLEELPNKVRDLLGIMVDVNLRAEAGREYVEVAVPAYPNPISYRGEYFYRSGSTNQALRGAALDRFLLRRQGRHWDGVPVPGVGVGDLDAAALAWFRRQALKSQRLSPEVLDEPDAPLLDKLHLRENAYLKRAALLLFHPDPERFVTGAFVKIGYFENNVDLRYQDEAHGSLFSQVTRTVEVLKAKYLKAWISYEGLQRVETWPVPEPALREAVLNAVVHKDYASAIPTQISVYPDRLMIWNPGQLPPQWTVESLLGKHASQPFNPDLANAFFRAGLIEAWGRGIERIVQACRQAGLPDPELRLEPTGLWTVFHFAERGKRSGKETGSTTQETTRETTRERILALLRHQPSLTRRELADRIGISPDGVKYHLDKLRSAGAVRRVGSTKAGHWEVLP
jgi:ATP-dependent DNA helicase RecG